MSSINGPTLSSQEVVSVNCPQTVPTAPDVDLMVTEVVVGDISVNEDLRIGDVRTTSTAGHKTNKSKVLVTLSDDLSYTLTIDGHSLSSVMDSIASDEYMKNEWNSWQRFISNPNQFFVYIYDNDFKEYVRYRTDTPIQHLSKIKIRNRFYVNQTDVKRGYHQLIDSQSPIILDDGFAEEPTDALITTGDQNNSQSESQNQLTDTNTTAKSVTTNQLEKNHNKDINSNIISHNTSNASQYHHNYHMNSPSAPLVSQVNTPCPVPTTEISKVQSPNTSQSPKLTKAAKKLFIITPEPVIERKKSGSETDSISGDILADSPTGPIFDWSQEQTITFLELCKQYSKELAPKKNTLEVRPSVWEQLAKELNNKDSGYSFDALMCRNHFSRLRLTYTNVLCYPTLRDESRWPYFELMKEIIGEIPEEMQSKVKTRAQHKSRNGRQSTVDGIKRSVRKANDVVMKNSVNHEVSELYVALLNLVKKYMKYFETEKKNMIWNRIESELNSAGYKWTANALRALFYRLRYTYIRLLKNVGEEEASSTWPYFRYFHGLDLKAFPCRRESDLNESTDSLKRTPSSRTKLELKDKRAPGRPRKSTPSAQTKTDKTKASSQHNQNHLLEYSDGQTSGSDVEAVENKRKKSETI